MTYLLRHPKTGVYYFRRAVPDELRTTIGNTAIKKSLLDLSHLHTNAPTTRQG
jgi:hypothetical protein